MPVIWTGENYEKIFQMLRGRGIEFDPEKLEREFWTEKRGFFHDQERSGTQN